MKRVKLPKKYKLTNKNPAVFRIIGEPSNYFYFWRFRIPIIIFRPICFLKGHNLKTSFPYGIKIRSCIRCGYVKFRKQTNEKPLKFCGEIGELYGVTFQRTTFVKRKKC